MEIYKFIRKRRMKRFLKAIFFTIVCFTCISVTTTIFTYENGMENGKGMREFYQMDNDEIQVLVIGSSHTGLGFSPLEMYKNTKITSYNLSSQKQPVALSYFLAEEAFKKQSPKVVVLDVASLFYTWEEILPENIRIVMDRMPLSLTKVRIARYYASILDRDIPEIFEIAEGLSPMYYYHDRWKTLGERDFTSFLITNLKGQAVNTHITELSYDINETDKKIESGEFKTPTILDESMDYFTRLKKLCDENGAELVLCTTPTLRWSNYKKDIVNELCEETGCKFIDTTEGVVDYKVDMTDENHVNAYGAMKVTNYFADFIIENYGLVGKASKEFDKCLEYYDAYTKVYDYELETDFDTYLEKLDANKEELVILMAVKNDTVTGLTEKDKELLKNLGLQTDFNEEAKNCSFVAVIDSGEVVFEKLSEKSEVSFSTKEQELNLVEDVNFEILSKGNACGKYASMTVNNEEYAVNADGLNIIVFDKESKCVLDTTSFYTPSTSRRWYRGEDYNNISKKIFTNYRDWVIKNK